MNPVICRLPLAMPLAMLSAVVGPPVCQAANFVIRGYVDGTVQSVPDAGAPADAAATLGKAVRFAAKVIESPSKKPKGWRGEWTIPFAALGLTPAPDLKVAFNASAFVSEFGEWHCWEVTLAETWRLGQAGTLQIAAPSRGTPSAAAALFSSGAVPGSVLPAHLRSGNRFTQSSSQSSIGLPFASVPVRIEKRLRARLRGR